MAKDPAFLFYPGDWLGGTMHMNHMEKGCYIDLLMLQFNTGKFTEAHAKHMLNGSFELVWPTVVKKFKCENGFFWNERLELEKEKRVSFTASRRNNALREKKDEAYTEHTGERMEDENINRSKSKKGNKKSAYKQKVFTPPTWGEFEEYCKSEGFSGIAEQAFKGYSVADWHDVKGDKIKNWKQKLQNGWFKKQNKDAVEKVISINQPTNEHGYVKP